MTMLKRCFTYLKRNGVAYSHSIHSTADTALDVAWAERMPARDLAKTVVYGGDNDYGMAVLPADHVVDFNDVRRLLGLANIRVASEPELAELFPDCEVGAMPPFGNLFNMPVLMDESLTQVEFMGFNAGTHRDVIHISTGDFRRLVKPLVAAFGFQRVIVINS